MIPLLALLACTSKAPPDHHDTGTADTGGVDDTGDTDDTKPYDHSGDDTDDTGDSGDDTAVDTGPPDADGDGFAEDVDCDDDDNRTYPGADEVCGDGVVNDCDGAAEAASSTCEHMLTEYGATVSWVGRGVHSNFRRLTPLGDVNGDGFDDIGIGAVHTFYDTGDGSENYDSGLLLIFNGPVGGEMEDFDARFFSTPEDDYASWDTVPMGDMDGDGYDDFAVGASDNEGGPVTGTPSVYLVHGPVVDTLWSTDDMVLLQGNTIEDCLGSVLAPTPDADGDGVADLLVGGRCQGQAHLVSGDGHEMVPQDDDIAFFYVPDPDGTEVNVDSRFGHSLASGDLDGDGLVDVAVGAPEALSSGPELGFVSVFAGPQGGTHSSDDADHTIAGALTDTQDGTASPPEIQLGNSLAIGDWNHDGHDDLAVGAPMRFWGDHTLREGGVYIYFGPLDQDDYGLPDADLSIVGDSDDLESENDKVGGELDGDDDIDGDGVDDLLIGNGRIEVNGYSSAGMEYSSNRRAWVVLGPLTGGTMLAADADVILHTTVDTVENGDHYGGFGLQARVAGDTDGDGRKELLIGDWSAQLYLFDIADVGGY